jgi:hypothetical protein
MIRTVEYLFSLTLHGFTGVTPTLDVPSSVTATLVSLILLFNPSYGHSKNFFSYFSIYLVGVDDHFGSLLLLKLTVTAILSATTTATATLSTTARVYSITNSMAFTIAFTWFVVV